MQFVQGCPIQIASAPPGWVAAFHNRASGENWSEPVIAWAVIAKRGVLVPIELDENGNILDGHHRKQAVDELGIKDYPTVVRLFSSDDEKEEHVVTLNVRRRHLTSEQKRKWAEWFLRRHPEWTDRRVASEVGLSHPTVAKVREELESSGDVEKLTTRIDSQGRAQQASKPKQQPAIFVPAKQASRAQKALSDLGDEAPQRQLDVKRAERMAREKEAERRRSEPVEPVTVTAHIDIEYSSLRNYRSVARAFSLGREKAPWSVYQMLAGRDDRYDILAEQDHWTVAEMRARLDRRQNYYNQDDTEGTSRRDAPTRAFPFPRDQRPSTISLIRAAR